MEPIRTYETVLHGQLVTVKVYPSPEYVFREYLRSLTYGEGGRARTRPEAVSEDDYV